MFCTIPQLTYACYASFFLVTHRSLIEPLNEASPVAGPTMITRYVEQYYDLTVSFLIYLGTMEHPYLCVIICIIIIVCILYVRISYMCVMNVLLYIKLYSCNKITLKGQP